MTAIFSSTLVKALGDARASLLFPFPKAGRFLCRLAKFLGSVPAVISVGTGISNAWSGDVLGVEEGMSLRSTSSPKDCPKPSWLNSENTKRREWMPHSAATACLSCNSLPSIGTSTPIRTTRWLYLF